jgi:hypothetical protein
MHCSHRVTLTYNLHQVGAADLKDVDPTNETGFAAHCILATLFNMLLCMCCLHRVTLTYNLHQVGAANLADVDPTNETGFARALQAKLKDAQWHAAGAKLGFTLEHTYAAGKALCFVISALPVMFVPL